VRGDEAFDVEVVGGALDHFLAEGAKVDHVLLQLPHLLLLLVQSRQLLIPTKKKGCQRLLDN
jgi:hypothetical protein